MKQDTASPGFQGPIWVAVLFFLLFGGAIAISTWHLSSSFRQGINSATTDGVVTSLERERDNRGDEYSRPIVQYKVDDRRYWCKGTWSSSVRYSVGDRVQVIYTNGNPEQASIDSFFERWFGPLCGLAIGLFFGFALGWGIIKRAVNNRRIPNKKRP